MIRLDDTSIPSTPIGDTNPALPPHEDAASSGERSDVREPGTADPATAASPGTRAAPAGESSITPVPASSPPELEAALRQRDEYYDRLLRKTAEFDNYRKRAERERRELSEYVVGEFAKELLPTLDDFDRALTVDARDGEALRQGIELVQKRLLDTLARRGVAVIDPLGEIFDPHQHEAVARVSAEGRRDGEIVEVFSRGYKIGDRLLRPAMVKVATA
jgi:molecular chaperone GrpE